MPFPSPWDSPNPGIILMPALVGEEPTGKPTRGLWSPECLMLIFLKEKAKRTREIMKVELGEDIVLYQVRPPYHIIQTEREHKKQELVKCLVYIRNRDPHSHHLWQTRMSKEPVGMKSTSNLLLGLCDYPRQHQNPPNQAECRHQICWNRNNDHPGQKRLS